MKVAYNIYTIARLNKVLCLLVGFAERLGFSIIGVCATAPPKTNTLFFLGKNPAKKDTKENSNNSSKNNSHDNNDNKKQQQQQQQQQQPWQDHMTDVFTAAFCDHPAQSFWVGPKVFPHRTGTPLNATGENKHIEFKEGGKTTALWRFPNVKYSAVLASL